MSLTSIAWNQLVGGRRGGGEGGGGGGGREEGDISHACGL